jgi:hypothetical protein
MSLTKEVFAASDEIQNGRTLSDIMLHLATEHGELAQEVQIASGARYKLSVDYWSYLVYVISNNKGKYNDHTPASTRNYQLHYY